MSNRIRVIDFETSGLEPPEAVVVESGFCDLVSSADGRQVEGLHWSTLHGFEGAMPPEVQAVHHISTEDLRGRLPYDAVAMWDTMANEGVLAVAAHNAEFEAKFWGDARLPVICTYKAALRAWPQAPSHSNGTLRYWLQAQGLVAPDHAGTMPPHRAGPDAYVTAWILRALLEAGHSAAEMVRWTREPRLLPTCPIGKFRGKPWPEVEAGFLNWMLAQASMEEDLKWNARRELERRQVQG